MDTKKLSRTALFVAIATLGFLFAPQRVAPVKTSAKPNPPSSSARAQESYGRIPLSFEANCGTTDASVDFLARGPGYLLTLSPTAATLAMRAPAEKQMPDNPAPPSVLRMNLVGAKPDAPVHGEGLLQGTVNYLTGNDPTQWRTNIPTFGRVHYEEVYPGIDLVYYGNQRRLEYDFVVGPGRDPEAIALDFGSAAAPEIDPATGDLLLRVGDETLRQHAPVTYQETDGTRRTVASRYAMRGDGRIGFAVGEYDRNAPLVIDPVLEYSTYTPAGKMALDAAGNAYIAGVDSSTGDVLVSKLNATGTALVYSTNFGGTSGDTGYAIAVDAAGSAYVTGRTASLDFPLVNPIQDTRGGGTGYGLDAFVTKLSPAGDTLVYSTYLGGDSRDNGYGIAVDAEGSAYVSGFTESTNFPVANAFQPAFAGGLDDAFLSKINPDGSALVYSTYLGGSGPESTNLQSFDAGAGIYVAVDSSGSACVTGRTFSLDFPILNAVQETNGGPGVVQDAFVSKFTPAGTALVFSTYLGGDRDDRGFGIAVDPAGNVYVTGDTHSADFPTFAALQPMISEGQFANGDVFVTKFTPAGAFVYSTYLGGNFDDVGSAIAADAAGNAYVTGSTESSDFPTVDAFQRARIGGFNDAFFAKINAEGSALVYSSYLGGGGGTFNNPGSSAGASIAVDAAGSAYVAGYTGSFCFPTTEGVFGSSYLYGGFITKINEAGTQPRFNPTPCTPSLLNISTRLQVLTGDQVLIGGFIVTGTAPKMVILRAIGPSLSGSGIVNPLADPVLELRAGDGSLITSSDNWTTDRAAIEATGLQPADDLEAAIVATLEPGSYTAIMSGANGGTGVGLVEAYDLDQAADSDLANISTRGLVETGNNVMIGGFITGSSTTVVVRAIGPALTDFGVANALADPTLELRDVQGTLIGSNDNWKDPGQTEIEATGLQPSMDAESALVEILPAGAYTAILAGAGRTTGVGLVEIYRLP